MIVRLEDGYKIMAKVDGRVREINKFTNSVGVSTIKGLMANPRLYYNGDLEGVLNILNGNDWEFTPRDGSKKEELLKKLIKTYTLSVEETFEIGEDDINVSLPDVIPYGRWVVGERNNGGFFEIFIDLPYFLLKDTQPKGDTYKEDMLAYFEDFAPAFLVLDDTLLAFRHIHKDVWDAVQKRDADAIYSLKWGNVSLADLIIPLYYGVIRVNVDEWVFKHLPRAIASAYILSIRQIKKAPAGEGNKKLREMLFAMEDLSVIYLLGHYVENKVKFAKLCMVGLEEGRDIGKTLNTGVDDTEFHVLYHKGINKVIGGVIFD